MHSAALVDFRRQTALCLVAGLLALAGMVSAAAGVYFAITRSQDFQWSGERLLLRHIDPWQVALHGNVGNLLIGTQNPNYLPELYLLLVPFGWMPLHAANLAWALCNVVFAVGSAVLATRFYGLRGRWWAVGVAGAMLAASPTRTSISNGQQGLLVLALWAAALLVPTPRGRHARIGEALLVGLSYLKYSFAPAVALYLLLRDGLWRGARRVGWTLVPPVAAAVLVWLWIQQPHTGATLLRQFAEPLDVAKAGYQPTGDPGQTLMDLLEFVLGGAPVAKPRLTLICFAVAAALTVAVLGLALRWVRRRGVERTAEATGYQVALTAAMSFALYKHHPYDEVVFLFAACYALRHRRQPAAIATLLLIGEHWYVQRFIDGRIPWSFAWAGARLASFLLLVACVYFTRPNRDAEAPRTHETLLLPVHEISA